MNELAVFILEIFKRTPTWVWAILAALVVLGAIQLRDRLVKRYTVLIAPAAFLVVGLMASARGSTGLVVWALSVAMVAIATYVVWRPTGGASYVAEGDQLQMPGSAIPMLLMLSIFVLNYAINVWLAINPALRAESAWQVIPALVLGTLSGVFIGRAATLFRMNRMTFARSATTR
jgi:hypothetical protein